MNKSSYSLLYNQLWVANPERIRLLNPNYVIPEKKKLDKAPKEIGVRLVVEPTRETYTKPVLTNIPQSTLPKASEPITNTPINKPLVLEWDVLVDQINNCTQCTLCDGRKNVVIERGSREARWMFIGEGPGEQEDIQGMPFVGNSGQLLDKMIAAMKLNKETDVYICNVVKCRPPYNRNPEIEEINACNNYLLSQIELVKPQIIIALGRFASQTLLNSNLATGKLRKQVHKYKDIPLIVTYHPSYLLRNPAAKKDAWEDLQLALKVFGE